MSEISEYSQGEARLFALRPDGPYTHSGLLREVADWWEANGSREWLLNSIHWDGEDLLIYVGDYSGLDGGPEKDAVEEDVVSKRLDMHSDTLTAIQDRLDEIARDLKDHKKMHEVAKRHTKESDHAIDFPRSKYLTGATESGQRPDGMGWHANNWETSR